MVQNAQSTPTHNHLVQAPSGLWLPRRGQHTSQPHLVQTPSVLPTQPPRTQQLPWTEKTIAGKTYWEWMSLLLVPLLVGIGTIGVTLQQTIAQNVLSDQQYKSAQEIAQQARFDDLLQNYRNGINTLILDKNLTTSSLGSNSNVRSVAYSQTLDILRQVDVNRKGKVIAYLVNLGLIWGDPIHGKEPIIPLTGATLNGVNFNHAELSGADLSYADLSHADLSQADLSQAGLNGANLDHANLSHAYLGGANLSFSDLRGANLSFSDLRGANLDHADLNGANLDHAKNITLEQLSRAHSS